MTPHGSPGSRSISNVLTIDVEEYFHPAEVENAVDPREWASLPSRLDTELTAILDLLDQKNVKATFFVLGWVAEHRGHTVRRIVKRGHEIGCHSYAHRLVYGLTPEEFREDTKRAILAIEDACGVTPRVYRAPSYSITGESMWALDILAECGFKCDSSIYPIVHDRYGIAGSTRHAYTIRTASGPILEIPIATVELSRRRVTPVGGGGYLRLLPYRYTSAGIRRINREERQPACIYFHPWEIDPAQPRLAKGIVAGWRTYTGIARMRGKVERLLTEFSFAPVTAVYGGSMAAHTTGAAAG